MPEIDLHRQIKFAHKGLHVKVYGPGKVDVPQEVIDWYNKWARPSVKPKAKVKSTQK